MVDRQGQDLTTVELTESQLQQVQAGENAVSFQNSDRNWVLINNVVNKSFFGFGGASRTVAGQDDRWDWAARVLEMQLTQIRKRLTDVLLDDRLLMIDAEKRLDLVGRSPLASMRELNVGRSVETVNPDRLMIEMFGRKDVGGKLLILGRPGAGKTTALLGLAEQLVCGAIANPRTVIPVIFELSAWKNDGQSIEAFLIEQLYDNFRGNRKIYETWLEQRLLLPLFDGLDELGMVRQGKCTDKLNEFARTYPQMVVCCRVREFETVGIKLNELNGSIVLQPLSNQQIQDYLVTVDRSGLWEQIMNTPEMALMLEPNKDGEPGLLRVPLFISIAAIIYDKERPFRNKGDLLEKYIDRQLSFDVREDDRSDKRFVGRKWAFKTVEGEYDRAEVRHSLIWLAGQLRRQNEVDLLIEQMQPSWLDSPTVKRLYRLISGLISGLIGGLTGGLTGGAIGGPIGGLISTLIIGLVFGLIGELDEIRPVEGFQISSRDLKQGLIIGLVSGLIGGLTGGLFFGLAASQAAHIQFLTGQKYSSGPIFGLTIGLISGLIGGLIGGLIESLREDLKIRSKPNQGIWNSLQSMAWNIGLNFPLGLLVALARPIGCTLQKGESCTVLPSVISHAVPQLLIPALLWGLLFAFLFGGGLACIQHLSLRIVLTHDKKIPWNYARFLNYCAERRLLQRIGGRYRFIHRELLDHFGMKN